LPDEVTIDDLDREVRAGLRSLPKGLAEVIGRHLVMAGRLIDHDPERAHAHALAATRRAARVAVVREAAGLTAYALGRYDTARNELRAYSRLSGSEVYLPVLADCERGLGHPERALTIAAGRGVDKLDRAGRIEMRIVAAGARRDLGQIDAAVIALRGPELRSRSREPWAARLRYAYADALLAAGRLAEAKEWFAAAAAADLDGLTDALERLTALEPARS
jgi:tetratricopeptide (TPR) repeat protein